MPLPTCSLRLFLDDGRRWGEAAADFQWEDFRAVLDADGTPYRFLDTYIHLLDEDVPEPSFLDEKVGHRWATESAETGRNAAYPLAAERAV